MAQITVLRSAEGTTSASLSSVTSGNVLLCVVHALRFFGADPVITSVSGGTGATWTAVQNIEVHSTANELGIRMFVGTGNTSTTPTATPSGTWSEVATVLLELSQTDCTVDVFDTGEGTGASPNIGALATLDSDEDLVVLACQAASGSINLAPAIGAELQDGAIGDWYYSVAALEVTSTTGPTCSWTGSAGGVPYVAQSVAFKVAAAAAGQPTSKRLGGVTFSAMRGPAQQGMRQW